MRIWTTTSVEYNVNNQTTQLREGLDALFKSKLRVKTLSLQMNSADSYSLFFSASLNSVWETTYTVKNFVFFAVYNWEYLKNHWHYLKPEKNLLSVLSHKFYQIIRYFILLVAELPRARRGSGASWVRKSGDLSMREIKILGEREGTSKATPRGKENAIFS